MIGASLSRWTMSYFAAALTCLLLAEALMAAGFGYPRAALRSPDTLVLVHVVAIGWLSLLMCGALFQFLPVLVAHPLHSNNSPLPALALLLLGLGALVSGFLQLSGRLPAGPPFLPTGGVLLGLGFATVLWNLARTLIAARSRTVPARFVAVALGAVAAAATLGLVFTLVLGGAVEGASVYDLTAAGVPVHLIAGLGGWLTFAAMGVSYRLLAMFMLAPELEGPTTKAALGFGSAALAVAILGGVAAILLHVDLNLALGAAAGLGVVAFAFYGADVFRLYRERRRPNIELNSRMAALALASLAGAILSMLVLLALGRLEEGIAAVVFLLAFGWLSGLGLAQLYKIVAFLTWLECYGPVLGKAPTPRVQDLVVERRAAKWFGLYFIAVWAGALALFLRYPPAFQASAALMLVATGGIVGHLVRTRCLADVKAAAALPAGARRPRLLLSLPQQT